MTNDPFQLRMKYPYIQYVDILISLVVAFIVLNANSETVGTDSFNIGNFAKAHYTSALTDKVSINL